MKNKKGFKYYALIFVFSTIALVVYLIYLNYTEEDFDFGANLSLLYVPIMFTGLLFVFDKLFELVFPDKNKKINNKYSSYLKIASQEIEKECEFSIEDYKKLRNNPKFQKGLEQAYRVYNVGENDEINFEFLQNKFKNGTNEYVAFQVVIKVVKKLMENS